MKPARLVFPGLRWAERGLEEVWREARRSIDLGVGGFVVFGGSVTGMRELVGRARDHAGRALLFAADLERGAGQQLAEATPLPPAAALARLDDAALLGAARLTAQEAAAAGIGWVLAPVADLDVEPANPIVGTRSFGADAAAVADRVRAWIVAAQSEGVLACAKHFPGHGRTTSDSHAGLPVVPAPRETLAADLIPFEAAISVGVGSIMMAHVSYPALDSSGTPASLSPRIIAYLRDALGYDGLIASDALIMEAVAQAGRSEREAAVQAVRAGCDALLYPGSVDATVAALEGALRSGDLTAERIAQALVRVEQAAYGSAVPAGEVRAVASSAQALSLAVASIREMRGSPRRLSPGQTVRLHIIDDDISWGPPLVFPEAARPDRRRLAAALTERGARFPGSEAGADVDLVAVFSEVRGWKGRAVLSSETRRRLIRVVEQVTDPTVVLFGHPRLAAELPSAGSLVCAWCGDPLMQEAVAALLFRGAPA
ncbi:MAG: hypothetical protein JSU87_06650 [Gemmatimonadota bacterium]|nr:MAG: hypothetical protein JSU87_06650 [Gemmatimonadota bacterium]